MRTGSRRFRSLCFSRWRFRSLLSVAGAILAAMREQPPISRSPEPRMRVITTRKLRDGGRSPAKIRTLIRNGTLIPVGHGIYVTRTVATQFKDVPHGDHVLKAGAAVLLSGPGCHISHQSAALLHNIDLRGGELSYVT